MQQAQIADEEEGERLTVEEAAAEAEAAEAAELEGDGFITDPDFVDEVRTHPRFRQGGGGGSVVKGIAKPSSSPYQLFGA